MLDLRSVVRVVTVRRPDNVTPRRAERPGEEGWGGVARGSVYKRSGGGGLDINTAVGID